MVHISSSSQSSIAAMRNFLADGRLTSSPLLPPPTPSVQRVGRFCPFLNFMKSHGLAVSLGMGNYHIFLNLVKKPGQYFHKIQGAKIKKYFFFWKMLSLMSIFYSRKSNLKSKIVWYFFDFLKRVIFQKKSSALIIVNYFLEFHTGT